MDTSIGRKSTIRGVINDEATKKFDTSFKLEVVRMIQKQGLAVQPLCQSMEIGLTAIRRWVTQYKAEQGEQRGIGNSLTAEQQRVRQLEQENRRLRMNVDTLRMASAFFARELK